MRRSPTASATAGRRWTSAPCWTAGSRNWSGSASCRSATRTCRPRSACGTSRSRCPRRAVRATTGTATRPCRAAPTGTATATSRARRPARRWARRGHPPAPAPGTCGRCCPVSGPSPMSPRVTSRRYVAHGPPGALNVTITAPADGSTLAATSTAVTGTTAPGAKVTVESVDTTSGAPSSVTSTTAAPDGSFSATVPIGFGSNAITVGASTHGLGSTGYARVTVSNEGGGTTVLDVSDPAGDDNGPGTYQYPTSGDFQPGAFDLTRFQVLSDGTTAYLRATIANLSPTFGQVDGAQLLDVYVHVPGAATTSTAAAFSTRNYTIASAGAWSQRLEVQGFAGPVWQDASANPVGTAQVLASQSDGTITIALPESTLGAVAIQPVTVP